MKAVLLTDAESKEKVVVVFGSGAAVFAKSAEDDNGAYTEIFNIDSNIIVTVTESTSDITNKLSVA